MALAIPRRWFRNGDVPTCGTIRLRYTRRGWFVVWRVNCGTAYAGAPDLSYDKWRTILIGPSATAVEALHGTAIERD
jgi:hypothetical protein